MPGSSATDIDRVPADQRVYLGSDAETGYIKFFTRDPEKTPGFDIHQSHTDTYATMGPAAALALGLTECCALFGRGKVRYSPLFGCSSGPLLCEQHV